MLVRRRFEHFEHVGHGTVNLTQLDDPTHTMQDHALANAGGCNIFTNFAPLVFYMSHF
jgi:hypothetical protein